MFKDDDLEEKDETKQNDKMLPKKRRIQKGSNLDNKFKYYKDKDLKVEADGLDEDKYREESDDEPNLNLNKSSKNNNKQNESNAQKTIKYFRTSVIHKIERIHHLHYCTLTDINGNEHKLEFDEIGDPEFKTSLDDYIIRTGLNKAQAQILYKRFDQAQEGNKINLESNNPEKIVTAKPRIKLKLPPKKSKFLSDEVIKERLDDILDRAIEGELDSIPRERLKCSKFITKVTYLNRGYQVEIDFDKYNDVHNPHIKTLLYLKNEGRHLCNPNEILNLLKHGVKKNSEHHIKTAHNLFNKYFKMFVGEIEEIISKCNGSGIGKDNMATYFNNSKVIGFYQKENLLEIKNIKSFVGRGNRWNPDGYIQYQDPIDRRKDYYFSFDEISSLVGKSTFDDFLTNQVKTKFKPLANQRKSILSLRIKSVRHKSFQKIAQKAKREYARNFLLRNDCFKNALTDLFGRLGKMGINFRKKVRCADLQRQIGLFNLENRSFRLEITQRCKMNLSEIPNVINNKCLIVFKIDDYRYHTFAYFPNKKIKDLTYVMAKNSFTEVFVVDYFLKE